MPFTKKADAVAKSEQEAAQIEADFKIAIKAKTAAYRGESFYVFIPKGLKQEVLDAIIAELAENGWEAKPTHTPPPDQDYVLLIS